MTKPIITPEPSVAPPEPHVIEAAVKAALAEDLGANGDITTNAIIDQTAATSAAIVTRQPGVVSGLPIAEAAFKFLDPDISFHAAVTDGDTVQKATTIATIKGNTRAVLSAERVALNFLGRLSGIATLTKVYVDEISGTGAKIIDTRKTTPGLRTLEKYAVRCGGGQNHRAGLYDAILIKDNHVTAAGGISEAINAAHRNSGQVVKIEVEVDTLDQLSEALKHKIDTVLLDNMTLDELKKAVELTAARATLEASGGVNLKTVRAIAQTGVDLISIGALTHSAPVLDLGLDFAQ